MIDDHDGPTPLERGALTMGMPRARALLFWVALLCLAAPAAAQSGAESTVVYLVRHAEKAAEPADDPPLTEVGQGRASALAGMLADAGVQRVWSTDYARTRETARPMAEGAGLAVELYDPRDPGRLVAGILASGERALVVGHSNTTPGLVRALGGDPGADITDDEYDRLYIVVIPAEGPVSTVMLRFGEGAGG